MYFLHRHLPLGDTAQTPSEIFIPQDGFAKIHRTILHRILLLSLQNSYYTKKKETPRHQIEIDSAFSFHFIFPIEKVQSRKTRKTSETYLE